MESYKRLLLANKAWAKDKITSNPAYFRNMESFQAPEFLWIGCSDSRVPAEEVTGTQPGEIFVHRNIANMVVHTDFNMLSVLEFAVKYLKVKHIIVCGHYGCGGVANALSNKNLGLINKWLRHIKDVYTTYRNELEKISDFDVKHDRLVELNVLEQVHNLAETTIIQQSWHEQKRPTIHGWVYQLNSGILNQLTMLTPDSPIRDIYRYDFSNAATAKKFTLLDNKSEGDVEL